MQIKTTYKPLDIEQIRSQFPILNSQVHGKPLVYLDNAASAQKPLSVIQAVDAAYLEYYSNVHRGVHYLSDQATRAYEAARETARKFINAGKEQEIIFTKGTTDGINLIASSFGRKYLQEGDEVILSGMEHHANIVPWQLICEERGANIKVIPVSDEGELDMEAYANLLSDKTKIVAVVHVSNTLGTVNPVEQIIEQAHARNIPVLLDGAQAVPHQAVDVQALDADFYVFSAHKIFGPTGTGILYGKESWLNDLPPYQGGGAMIRTVTFEKTTFNELPEKFEAGTPNIAGVIGMGKAMEFIQEIGYEGIQAQELELLKYTTEKMEAIEGVRIIGTANEKAAVISFVVEGTHPSDLGTLLDVEGIAVRTGHHCTQPLMERYGVNSTVRASFAFYNTLEEADRFIAALEKAIAMFK